MIDYKRGTKSYDDIIENNDMPEDISGTDNRQDIQTSNDLQNLSDDIEEEIEENEMVEDNENITGEQNEKPFSDMSNDKYSQIAQEHIKDISDSDLRAFNDYSDFSYKDINNHLREGGSIDNDKIQDIDTITNNMNSLEDNYQLYRGQPMEPILGENWQDLSNDELQKFVGTEYEDKAFVSTSTDIDVAKKYGSFGGLLEINAPEGTKAMAMREISTYANSDKEMLLQRGLNYRIDSIEKINNQPYLKTSILKK